MGVITAFVAFVAFMLGLISGIWLATRDWRI
jgi:uncharacterized protein YneF (UPF0154 family)